MSRTVWKEVSEGILDLITKDPKAQRLGVSHVMLSPSDWVLHGQPTYIRLKVGSKLRCVPVTPTKRRTDQWVRWDYCDRRERQRLYPEL